MTMRFSACAVTLFAVAALCGGQESAASNSADSKQALAVLPEVLDGGPWQDMMKRHFWRRRRSGTEVAGGLRCPQDGRADRGVPGKDEG